MSMLREYLDRPPAGWFALDVMRKEARKWDWVALMIDVHPDELKHCLCITAFLYVDPNEYRPKEAAQRVKPGSASPASTGTGMPPGPRWKT